MPLPGAATNAPVPEACVTPFPGYAAPDDCVNHAAALAIFFPVVSSMGTL